MAQSWLCSLCRQSPALTFCYCNRSETFLCEGCLPAHFSKNPGRFHQNLPLSAFGPHRNPGYFEKLQNRLEAVESGKQTLWMNVTDIDKCIAEFTGMINQVMKVVWEYGEVQLAELHRIRWEMTAKIEVSIQEAERSIYEEQPILISDFAGYLLANGNQAKLRRFIYDIDWKNTAQAIIDLTYSIGEQVTIEDYPKDVTQDSVGEVLPMISGTSLKCYNLRTGETRSATLSVKFTSGATFCLINPESVLCIGGYPGTKDVFRLSLSNCTLTPMAPMITARGKAAITKCGSFVYVFGGLNGNACVYESEKYDIETNVWTNLPKLSQFNFNFTTVVVGRQLYQAKATHCFELQTFDTDKDTFAIISSSPSLLSVSFIAEGQLHVLFRDKLIAKQRLNSAKPFTLFDIQMNNYLSCGSNITPMRFGRSLYWVNSSNGNLVKYNIDTQTIVD